MPPVLLTGRVYAVAAGGELLGKGPDRRQVSEGGPHELELRVGSGAADARRGVFAPRGGRGRR